MGQCLARKTDVSLPETAFGNYILKHDSLQMARQLVLDKLASPTANDHQNSLSHDMVADAILQILFGKISIRKPLSSTIRADYYITCILPIKKILDTASNISFDVMELDNVSNHQPLSTLGYWVLRQEDLIRSCDLDESRLINILQHIEKGYAENPYHNRIHIADVLQKMYYILSRPSATAIRNNIWLLASYFACIVHDFEHAGVTNDFLVQSKHSLAVEYNDISPNENHHVAAAFAVLYDDEFNFICNMSSVHQNEFRELVIDLVLATDMTKHIVVLNTFHLAFKFPIVESDTVSQQKRNVSALELAIKCSDLGHVAAPEKLHRKWVTRLENEMFLQGDLERKMKLIESPLMQREGPGITSAQTRFFEIIVIPTFDALIHVFPDAKPMLNEVMRNYNIWTTFRDTESTDDDKLLKNMGGRMKNIIPH